MSFNFGDKPFKHNLPNGYSPISTVPKDKIITNSNGQTSTEALKPMNNAPQAIIIEVSIFNYRCFKLPINV